ncbi:MAG: outer membrane beta-barrel protein [Ekhidna sp.]|nr:outer membrane beta-barrel protein [Ekhidna sp.]
MQTINTRHKLDLLGRKIILIATLLCLSTYSFSQNSPTDHLINYEDQWIHYGFLLGGHSSKYVIKYSDTFTTPALDTVHSIIPGNLAGFKSGFIINMKVAQYLDFRILPTVSFYENDLTYRFTNGSILRELKDATMIELPLLFKYKSARRGNLAMYMVIGANPSIEAAGKGDERDIAETLELKNWNIAIDVGLGLDIFYPFFKFSPEIRYSYGLRNMLNTPGSDFSVGLDRLSTQNLGIFITFEGGPQNERKLSKKRRRVGIGRDSSGVKNRHKKRLRP